MMEITSGRRLHFGLLAPAPIDGFEVQFGGLGAMVDAVGVHFTATLAKTWSYTGPQSNRIQAVIQRLGQHYAPLHPMHFTVHEAAPAHQGWGTGTQMALEVALVVLAASGQEWNLEAVSTALGRGQRSAIGVAGYERPGFYFDPGRTKQGRAPLQHYVLPSSWTWVLVEPGEEQGLHADAERQAFANLQSLSPVTAHELLSLATKQIVPAIRQRDFDSFADGLTRYNYLAGSYYSQVQHGHYATAATTSHIATLKQAGVRCYGQSSWGPGLFTLFPSKSDAEEFASSVMLPGCRLVVAGSR
jgi:beta-ribofuranosylaminobenzene 5'-phosphate synthase